LFITIHLDNKDYKINLKEGIDLSIPNNFDGSSPIFFDGKSPQIHPAKSNNFVGSIKEGGSCNVPIAKVDIHCSGTHTECIGHIDNSGIKISDIIPNKFLLSQLITVNTVQKSSIEESYHVECNNDLVISVESIRDKIYNNIKALIIRTNPNNSDKLERNYNLHPAPFLTHETIDYLIEKKIEHLLVDLPSIDKADDDGKLNNHHRFFNFGKTISELLFIPEYIKDGIGFTQIQIPNWGIDAAPSRPIFYPIS